MVEASKSYSFCGGDIDNKLQFCRSIPGGYSGQEILNVSHDPGIF